MTLNWTAVAEAAGYRLWRDGARTGPDLLAETRFVDTSLKPGTTYRWQVAAVDKDGRVGALSESVRGTTTGKGDGGGDPSCITADNVAHTMAGRAYVLLGMTYALGSNDPMGLWNVFTRTTLRQTRPAYYDVDTNCR